MVNTKVQTVVLCFFVFLPASSGSEKLYVCHECGIHPAGGLPLLVG